MTSRHSLPALALCALLCAACSSDTVTSRSAPFDLGLSLIPAADTIRIADTVTASDVAKLSLQATSLGAPVDTPTGVEWSSADPTIASVDPTGTVHAVHPGTTMITARINGVKATSSVVVAYRAAKLTVTPATIAGLIGDTVQISAVAVDAGGVAVPRTSYVFTVADPTAGTLTPTGTGSARLVLTKAGSVQVVVTAGGQSSTSAGTTLPREFISSLPAGAPTGGLSISAGDDATCGLLPLGRGYCFGKGLLLGVAKDTSCFNDVPAELTPCTLVPLRIAGGLAITSISVGDSVACATTAGNLAYCWGSQAHGQLGNGASSQGTSLVPSLVVGASPPSPAVFSRVSAGGNHACGLTPSNAAWCWGADDQYQLGNGESFRLASTTPIPVAGGATYLSISAGRSHTCAIRTDNAAACWGDNRFGQLGIGVADTTRDAPVLVNGPAFASISSGATHTCALTAAGVAWCWGNNDVGQLGRGIGAANPASPNPVAGSLTFRSISAGRRNTCGITTAGTAYCWGENLYGQIGDGARGDTLYTPTAVAGGRSDFTSVTVGTRHACAVGASGAYCWGSNVLGALGNGLQAIIQNLPMKTATPQ